MTDDTQISEKSQGILDVGSHCAYCTNVDFLPFTCDGCGKVFCSDHRQPFSHECKQEIAKEKERLKALAAYASGHGPMPASKSSTASQPKKTTLPQSKASTKKPTLQEQREIAQKRYDEANKQRNAAKKEATEKTSKNNMAALEKLRNLLGSKSSSSIPSSSSKSSSSSKWSFGGITSSKYSSSGLTKAETKTPLTSSKTASKLSASALIQLKKEAKPLDPNRPTNVAINGCATPSEVNPGRRYLVLVAYGSVIGPYSAEATLSPGGSGTATPNSSNSKSDLTKRDTKTATVYMANNIVIGKIVDRAVETLRVPKTKTDKETNEIKRAALFWNNEFLPYNEKLNKVVGGAIKDGDRLTIKYA